MPINNASDRDRHQNKAEESSANYASEERKGSAFKEIPPGTQTGNLFSETSPIPKPDDEKDVLSEETQKPKPQPDADV